MLTDNFNLIRPLLDFSNDDEFYHIMIFRRKKDNPKAKHAKLIKDIYVDNLEYLTRKEEYIKELCDFMNARAYINFNKRSYRKTALNHLKILADYIGTGQDRAVLNATRKAVGKATVQDPKYWIIDIDGPEQMNDRFKVIKKVETLHESMKDSVEYNPHMLTTLSTKNGMHLITTPFNFIKFDELCKEEGIETPDVKKDNPTILYTPA